MKWKGERGSTGPCIEQERGERRGLSISWFEGQDVASLKATCIASCLCGQTSQPLTQAHLKRKSESQETAAEDQEAGEERADLERGESDRFPADFLLLSSLPHFLLNHESPAATLLLPLPHAQPSDLSFSSHPSRRQLHHQAAKVTLFRVVGRETRRRPSRARDSCLLKENKTVSPVLPSSAFSLFSSLSSPV